MSDLIEILDQGCQRRVSWVVARDLSTRSARHRLDALSQKMTVALSDVADPLGEGWQDIALADAKFLAHNFAKAGIAYAHRDKFRRGIRDSRVTGFFDQFSADGKAVTNWGHREGFSSGSAFTTSTMDRAFGVLDGEKTGIICIEDED
mgnify:CR=1 FL=1|tara:strand:- start:6 stop:449 length:444 start_codon:yes stop_codon:yes gene_type:complete